MRWVQKSDCIRNGLNIGTKDGCALKQRRKLQSSTYTLSTLLSKGVLSSCLEIRSSSCEPQDTQTPTSSGTSWSATAAGTVALDPLVRVTATGVYVLDPS